MEGAVNSEDAVKGLEMYKAIYKCCTPPGYTDSYMGEGLDAFKSGQVAMMMNWFAFMPGMYKDEKVGGDKVGFFVNPGREGRGLDARRPGHLGRRQHRQHGRRARLHQMVRAAGRAEEVVVARRLCLPQRRAERSGLQGTRSPSRPTSSKAMGGVQDFWQEPAYASLLQAMQKRLHDYVVADQGTAKEALDKLIEDWTAVFKEEGKIE